MSDHRSREPDPATEDRESQTPLFKIGNVEFATASDVIVGGGGFAAGFALDAFLIRGRCLGDRRDRCEVGDSGSLEEAQQREAEGTG